ncbi:hypothetical protein C1645_742529 [Glomus cerebriforme]|uniref:Uncharacterized protein n=1 Tax=Glomus cerebriforme TaxID=658196 RepID=A0A397SNF4_9GLOM|nr:hypothetical protein C1645_742529 [Glomus cerebriforme]
MDKLYEENKALQERSKKRLKSKERSSDEANDIAARLKYLLRDVLDPTAEEIQHAKKQQKRIYDDDTYFMYSKLPENTLEWTYDAEKIRNEATDIKMLEYEVNDNNDKMTQYDDASLTNLNLDYLLNSAEMNLIRPEDLDEIGKSSQSLVLYY